MSEKELEPGTRFKHVLPGEHVYEGILFFGFTPLDILDAVREFEVRDDDVFLATYPKAGTTWIQEIVWLIMNDGDFEGAYRKPVYFRSPFLEFKDTILNEVELDLANPMPSPRVIKTHLPVHFMPKQVKEKNCKTIILFRNPKDLCVSYYNFYKSSSSFGNFKGSWPEFLDMFLGGHVDHGSWFDYTRGWWREAQGDKVYLMFFEDMKKDLHREVTKLCHFLQKELPSEIIDRIASHCDFDNMKRNLMINHLDVYSINSKISPLLRKGTVGDWKTQFTVAQNEVFDKFYIDTLGELDIPFKFDL